MTDYRYLPQNRIHGNTEWVNPLEDKSAVFEVLTNNATGKLQKGVAYQRFVIKPGETAVISSQYDQAIRTESKLGQVIGGVCPWLMKKGETEINLHPSMKAHEEIEKAELYKMATKIKEERDLEEARAVKAELKKSGKVK